ncbi:MAG TPA: GerMN domain-containing protein [Candidatus Polarisedimenticolaceae bacterium]
MRRLAVTALALAALACGGERPRDRAAAPEPGAPPPSESELDAANAPATVDVTVYFPGPNGRELVGETRGILPTPLPGDRAKQIVQELIAGSRGGAERAIPEGTTLRQVFVEDDGTAWVDLSPEFRNGIGGTADELLQVYAVVDSIGLNVPGITKVGLIVDGRPLETLNGHLDLRRPLPPRRDLVAGGAPAEE